MSLTSFPPVEEDPPQPSLYTKLHSVASNMLQFVRKDELPSKPQSKASSAAGSLAPSIRTQSTPILEPERPLLLRIPTQSLASVALDTEPAVPLLQPLHPFTPASNNTFSLPKDEKIKRDTDSVFSVSSSASKAYLAFQLSKAREKPARKQLSKEFWMKDESAISCYGCNRVFTTLRRKHHCRVCGQIFCSACTHLTDGERCGAKGTVRICTACEDAIASASSSDEGDTSVFTQAAAEYDDSSDSVENYSVRLNDDLHVARSFLLTPRNLRNRGNSFSSFTSHGPEGMRITSLSTPQAGHDAFQVSTAKFTDCASVELNTASLTYLSFFLDQLLKDSDLDPTEWNHVVSAPLHQVAAGLHLELNDKISPREWVKIKRIPGGIAEDIEVINGTVFTHSLARASMPTKIFSPQILLIAFPIDYRRNGRYTSLEPVLAQQKEFLNKLVARITNLKPTLLLSTQHICGEAIDMLQSNGIAVGQFVRESALLRLGNIVNTSVLYSADKLQNAPMLGTCKTFEMRAYRHNNMAKFFFFFFVNSSDPGRCAIIRGDTEISGVIKVVIEVMTEICYSLKAETALMRDQFVQLPSKIEKPALVLSSSPFVDYGTPFLQSFSHELEDLVVKTDLQLDNALTKVDKYVLQCDLENWRNKWVAAADQWAKYEAMNPFIFNPSSHQNLIILYSSVCMETETPCVGPEQQLIEFYLNTDETVGRFVERSILKAEQQCLEGCNYPMSKHYASYVSGTRSVTIKTEPYACKVPGLQDSILMWSYCKACQQQMPVVPMSSTTWKYSMGKYLELSLYGEFLKMRASTCTHNIYTDHVRYFGWQDYAVSVEYSNVDINEVYGPPKTLTWDPRAEIMLKQKYFDELKANFSAFWGSIKDHLDSVNTKLEEDKEHAATVAQLLQKQKTDEQLVLTQLVQLHDEAQPYDYLSLNKIFELYQGLVDQWQSDFISLDKAIYPQEKDLHQAAAQHIRGLMDPSPEKTKTDEPDENEYSIEELSIQFEQKLERERQALRERRNMNMRHPVAEVFEDIIEPELDLKKQEDERKEPKQSILQSLTNLWTERTTTGWSSIKNVLNSQQHYFTNSTVIVREKELSSLIAFCLNLPDYKSRVQEFFVKQEDNLSGLEKTMLRQTGTHMRYQFDRNNTKMSCKVFFCEQFDALRQKCIQPDKYIQSLSRCGFWDSTGGKSGSSFFKTADDRFIIKELTHAEFDSFVAFAPSYFEYMSQALFHDLPTMLAKLFGVYQVTVRKGNASPSVKMYVIVMENVFYCDKSTKFFDLKGSMRNRRATETGKAKEVLLDENMVEYIYDTPLFVHEHSKRTLRASLYNDTLFLTKMNIMDYSLVIGLDMEKKTIVAGVIDYIRTYTWDKKVESWVKARTAATGVKEPTVISPKQYKNRFRESMERYFVMVPDCWSQPDHSMYT